MLQFFKGLNVTADQKKFFRKAFHTYYDAAAELLQSEHAVRFTIIQLLLSRGFGAEFWTSCSRSWWCALIWAKNLLYFLQFSGFIFCSPFIKWSMKTLRSSVLEESSMMKMPLHMKSYENPMIICTAISHRKLIYEYLVTVASIPLVTRIWVQDFVSFSRFLIFSVVL